MDGLPDFMPEVAYTIFSGKAKVYKESSLLLRVLVVDLLIKYREISRSNMLLE